MMKTYMNALFAAIAFLMLSTSSACNARTEITAPKELQTQEDVVICTTVTDARDASEQGTPPSKDDPTYWMLYELKDDKHQGQSVRIPITYESGSFCRKIHPAFPITDTSVLKVTCRQFCKPKGQKTEVRNTFTFSPVLAGSAAPVCSTVSDDCSGMTVNDTLEQSKGEGANIKSTLDTEVQVTNIGPEEGIIKCDMKLKSGPIIHKCWTKWIVPGNCQAKRTYHVTEKSPFIESWGWGKCTYIRKEKETYDVHKTFHNPLEWGLAGGA